MVTGDLKARVDKVWNAFWSGGIVEPGLLFSAPFTDAAPTGPVALFGDAKANELVAVLRRIRETAEAG